MFVEKDHLSANFSRKKDEITQQLGRRGSSVSRPIQAKICHRHRHHHHRHHHQRHHRPRHHRQRYHHAS